jgi:D-serine deaminase-like pyridoxal phosphate-dependent protein
MTMLTKNSETESPAFTSSDVWAELDTPCTLIAADVVERNITRMADYCRQHGISLRPHTKTHKSKRIGRMQLDVGAVGLTVAKPGEADVMSELGAEVLIAYPSVTQASLKAIERGLANANVMVAVDSLEAVERLDNALRGIAAQAGVLVDIDIGLHRTGVQGPDESIRLAAKIASSPKLRLDGLFCYPGHIWSLPPDQNTELAEVEQIIQSHLNRWRNEGFEAKIVSGGSTPTAYQTHLSPSVNEIRPGTYVFNDLNTLRGGYCSLADCAVRIVATVVSAAVPGQVVIDAGAKTLAVDQCISAPDTGHGLIVEYPAARIRHLSEEHGQVDVSKCEARPGVGERVTIIPNHVCPTINLTDFAWWVTPQGVERLPIDARGKVR